MRRDEMIEALRTSPFRPFRMYVSDGAEYEIRHPEMMMVFRSSVNVGIPVDNAKNSDSNGSHSYPDLVRSTAIDLRHITRIEELQPR